MKKIFGFCILVILLVAISGCAQQAAQTTPATTPPTTVATTVVTTLATTEPTPAPTTMVTALPVATNATVEPTLVGMNLTTAVPTVLQTPNTNLKPQTQITTISIANNTFNPKVLTVLPGTGITWRNDDTVIHAVKVIGTHAGMFNSGDIIPGSSWSYTFNQNVDTYQIGDPNFPQMNSTIVVVNGQNFAGTF